MDTKNNQKQTGPLQIRQGDILLTKIDDEIMQPIKPVRGMLVLARGELTGHAHTVPAEDASLLLDTSGGMILEVNRRTRLVHQEHAPIDLEPGAYEVSRQQDYHAGWAGD